MLELTPDQAKSELFFYTKVCTLQQSKFKELIYE
jgi:hypothetical protein